MLKRTLKILAFFVLLCGIAFLGINLFLAAITKTAINFAIKHIHVANLTFGEPSFKHVKLHSYNAIAWDYFSLTAATTSSTSSKKTLIVRMDVKELAVKADKFSEGLFNISLKGLSLFPENPSTENAVDKDVRISLQEGSLTAPIKLNFMDPANVDSQIRNFAFEMKKFFEEGKTSIPITFSAKGIIAIKGSSFAVNLWTEKDGDVYRLAANTNDLINITKIILPKTQSYSHADIDIIARNPIKALGLLKINFKASDTALRAYRKDPKVPEDAYRHVLWSYLLTKEYGADFAKEVTDAHEQTMDPEEMKDPEPQASHQKDYHNNEVGRYFAAQGYKESNILKLVMSDPRVIR